MLRAYQLLDTGASVAKVAAMWLGMRDQQLPRLFRERWCVLRRRELGVGRTTRPMMLDVFNLDDRLWEVLMIRITAARLQMYTAAHQLRAA